MRRNWIKVYVDQCLRGTMISELAAAERWAWIGMLLMAGDSNEDGKIFLRKNPEGQLIGYSEHTLSELLGLNVKELQSAKRKMVKFEKISIDKNNVITIEKWSKYQSEYQRQKPYREAYKSDENNHNLESNLNNNLDRDKDIDIDIDKDKEKSPKSKISLVHLGIAELLEKGIKSRLPKHKIVGEKYLENWANEFRIMIENKEATESEIRELIVWIYRDSDFWHRNVLSADKFRKQFGRIWEEMKDKQPKRDTIGQHKEVKKPRNEKQIEYEYREARTEKHRELRKKYNYTKIETIGEMEDVDAKIKDELAKWHKEYYEK